MSANKLETKYRQHLHYAVIMENMILNFKVNT